MSSNPSIPTAAELQAFSVHHDAIESKFEAFKTACLNLQVDPYDTQKITEKSIEIGNKIIELLTKSAPSFDSKLWNAVSKEVSKSNLPITKKHPLYEQVLSEYRARKHAESGKSQMDESAANAWSEAIKACGLSGKVSKQHESYQDVLSCYRNIVKGRDRN